MSFDAQSAANKLALINSFRKDPAENDLSEGGLLLQWMDSLTSNDLAECVFKATLRGQELLVRTLIERRGPVPIHFEYKYGASLSYFLNGNPISRPDYFYAEANEPAELKSLLSMVREFDMQGLLVPGPTFPLMLQGIDTNEDIHHFNTSIFEGDLPFLDHGVLHTPELAIALADEIACAATPDAYSPMLCWATEEMARQFPLKLAPLRSYQEVVGRGSMAQWKASAGDPDRMAFTTISLGLKASDNASILAPFLANTMGPEEAVMGFDDLQGRVLCETTVDFLLQFPADESTIENYALAERFVRNYCPMDIIATQAAEVCVKQYGHPDPDYKFKIYLALNADKGFNQLFFMLRKENSLRERALEMMTHEQWLWLIQKAESQLDAVSVVAIRDTFGLDNTGMNIKLDDWRFRTYFEAGYRFADGTKFFDQLKPYGDFIRDPKNARCTTVFTTMPDWMFLKGYILTDYQRVERMVFACKQMLATNLWPVMGEDKPTSVKVAFRESMEVDFQDFSNKKAMALYAYLVTAGIDACAESAKSPEQWMKLTEIFGADELNPYLKVMPSQARGRALESVLGL
jgi:hypothetical protein